MLERGTAGTSRNIFLYAPRIGLDIGGSGTCTQLAVGTLTLRNVLTAGAIALGEGTTGVGCPGTEAGYLTSVADQNAVLPNAAGQLLSTDDLFLPDLRPVAGWWCILLGREYAGAASRRYVGRPRGAGSCHWRTLLPRTRRWW